MLTIKRRFAQGAVSSTLDPKMRSGWFSDRGMIINCIASPQRVLERGSIAQKLIISIEIITFTVDAQGSTATTIASGRRLAVLTFFAAIIDPTTGMLDCCQTSPKQFGKMVKRSSQVSRIMSRG